MAFEKQYFTSFRLLQHALCVWIALFGSVQGWATTTTTTTTRKTTARIFSPLTTTSRSLRQQQHLHQQQQSKQLPSCCYATSSDDDDAGVEGGTFKKKWAHTLAILSMPSTSTDKIANEAILNQVVQDTSKLSVVLRAQGKNPSLSSLRRYVGEVYSTLWDVASQSSTSDPDVFCDVVVYPQNLPNAAPEQWLHHAPDLDSVCSHDSICGWVSESAFGRGLLFQQQQGDGYGGLDVHVKAINADRAQRNLKSVQAIHVDPWPLGASSEQQKKHHVLFLDDEEDEDDKNLVTSTSEKDGSTTSNPADTNLPEDEFDVTDLIGGAHIPTECSFEKVAVGGTFDGMHYGHRKLLTLAVSSVHPTTGQLLVGVTVDAMLRHKSYSEYIPNLKERMEGAREFVYRLAPGIKNRVRVVPISDAYGPPGAKEDGAADFDALVLSHETLDNGCKLNKHRQENLGLEPLTLLCTRRTEPHGMSSTALRRRRYEKVQLQKKKQQKSEKAKI